MVDCALEMIKMINKMTVKLGQHHVPLTARAGIHTGLIHAGLVGWAKMIYDMWGVCSEKKEKPNIYHKLYTKPNTKQTQKHKHFYIYNNMCRIPWT